MVQTQKGSVMSDRVVVGSDTQRGVSWFLCSLVLCSQMPFAAFTWVFEKLVMSKLDSILYDVK